MAKGELRMNTTPREGVVFWQEDPRVERVVSSTFHCWVSSCGNYKLTRIDGGPGNRVRYASMKRRDDTHWDLVESDRSLGAGYPLYHDTLEGALAGLEREAGLTTRDREGFLREAASRDLSGTPQSVSNPPAKTYKKRKTRKSSPEDAVLKFLSSRKGEVSWEEVCKGAGLAGKNLSLLLKLVRSGRVRKGNGGVRLS